ncbi:hypothetical protein EVA_09950 [gut metagenome]|uniref:Uncharacterized protein n=1 Tax=gut metagenome TaxID=749906 RepID=J9GPN4_9ZZZZ
MRSRIGNSHRAATGHLPSRSRGRRAPSPREGGPVPR